MAEMTDGRPRCGWATPSNANPVYLAYHDEEWGVASRDPAHLFEMLTLEGAQAGLSWATILRKRAGYQAAFAGFGVAAVAGFGLPDIERLMADSGIVRNRAKIESTIENARALVTLRGAGIDPVEYLWSFVGGRPSRNHWPAIGEAPAETAESRAMSRALKRRGFRFVGPTVCYSFMQAVGMVNDHAVDCFRWAEIDAAAADIAARQGRQSDGRPPEVAGGR